MPGQMLRMSAMKGRRCPLEAKTNISEPKSPETLTTSNPNQGADTVNRRTSESNTVRRQNDKSGIHGIRFVGIKIASELIAMPASSDNSRQSATTPRGGLQGCRESRAYQQSSR